jgi:hypothetical protein
MMVKDPNIIERTLPSSTISNLRATTQAHMEGRIESATHLVSSNRQAAATSIIVAQHMLRTSCKFLVSYYDPQSEVEGMDTFLELSSILHGEIDKHLNGGTESPPPLAV